MSLLQPLLTVSFLLHLEFVKCDQVILGEPFTFPEFGNCTEASLIHCPKYSTYRKVADRREGVWIPEEDYKDRADASSHVGFKYTTYNDDGLYELRCANNEEIEIIQLDVVLLSRSSVTEGETVYLDFHYNTLTSRVESVRWVMNGKLMCGQNVTSGQIKYGPGYEDRVSLSPGGLRQGNLSLILERAQVEDQDLFLCYVQTIGERETIKAAVKLTVHKANNSAEITDTPKQPPTTSGRMETCCIINIVLVVIIMVILIVAVFYCCNKLRASPASGGKPQTDVETELITRRHSES